jgi:hypothetical protein
MQTSYRKGIEFNLFNINGLRSILIQGKREGALQFATDLGTNLLWRRGAAVFMSKSGG